MYLNGFSYLALFVISLVIILPFQVQGRPHTDKVGSIVLDAQCLSTKARAKCEEQAKNRFGYGLDAITSCCVQRYVIKCEIEHRRTHCSQHTILVELFDELHQNKFDDLENKCGGGSFVCGRDGQTGLWFTLILILVGAIVFSSLCIIICIYFRG